MEAEGATRLQGAAQDAAPLLQQQEAGEVASSSSDALQAASSSSSGQGLGWRAALSSWLAGRHRPQPVPSEDGSEVQLSRPASVAASISVLEEGGGASGGTTAAAAGAVGQQHEQQVAAASSSSSAEGGSSQGEIEPRGSGEASSSSDGGRPIARLPSRGPPTCLICLEEFRQEEFVNGSALRLECNCRGDLALRHRECVMKWVQVKGSNVCELCKAEIRNIPAPPPRPSEADLPQLDEAYFADPSHIHDFMPSSQDLVFDCIRVTWVAMIVSILFFEMSLGAALWTGLLAGFAYSIMVRLMYRQHFYAMRRLAEQQAAARREAEGGGALPGAGPVPHPIVIAV